MMTFGVTNLLVPGLVLLATWVGAAVFLVWVFSRYVRGTR